MTNVTMIVNHRVTLIESPLRVWQVIRAISLESNICLGTEVAEFSDHAADTVRAHFIIGDGWEDYTVTSRCSGER